MHNPGSRLFAIAVLLIALAAGCGGDDGLAERQAEVAQRGAEVMPFNLDATTHTFTTTEKGGVQIVAANDPDATDQIELIRLHLAEERDNFAVGNFDDPAAIHGHDMDGVEELRAGYRDIQIEYDERPDGAQLTYTTTDPALVDAIHAWFGRQLMDHGAHAEAG